MHKLFFPKVLIFTIALSAVLGGHLYAQTPPSVLTVSPPRHSLDNNPAAAISVQFDSPLNGATVTAENFVAYGEQSGFHAGTLNYNAGNSTITFDPTTPFQAGERVTVILTTDITGSNGAPLDGFQWSFYVRSAASTGVFDLDSTYTTSNGPHFVGVGQLNANADLDIAIPHTRSVHQTTVWSNDGSGNFAQIDAVNVGNTSRSLAVADLDQDGDMDIAVASEIANSVAILTNNGNGNFTSTATLPVELAPNHITAGDLNSDGRLDLVTANTNSNSISLLINNGGGTFAGQVPVLLNGGPQASHIADFNNDGFADIAATDTTSGNDFVTLLLNDGAGNFTAPVDFPTGNHPRAIVGSDFNGDGLIDVVISNRDDNTVSVLFNTGGAFSLPNNYNVGTDPVAIAAGDWNGDGNADFAVSNRVSGDLYVFLNNGAGSFPTSDTYPLGAEPRGLNAGDFNGDGVVDLAAANFSSNTLQVLFNNFGAGENEPPGAPSLTAPADHAFINPNTTPIQLSWNVPVDADGNPLHFLIEIATSANFANPVVTFDSRDDVTGFNPAPPVAQGAGSVTYSIAASLSDGVYFWRVTARDALTFGAPSSSRRFTVDTASPIIDRVVITEPVFAPNWYNPNAAASINFGAQYDEARPLRAEFNLGALGGIVTQQPILSGQDQLALTTVTFGSAADGSYPLSVTIFDSTANPAANNTTIRLDRTAPTGARASSPATSAQAGFTVSWSAGSDGSGSGLSGRFTVRVQTDGGAWQDWLTNFQGASSTFTGEDGHSYAFEAAAHDNVGNIEAFANTAETTTVVDFNANDTEPPAAPINLSADGANPSPWKNTASFLVAWQEPSDPSGIDEAFYKLGSPPTSNADFTDSVQGATSVQIAASQQNGQNVYVWLADGNGNVNFQNNASVALRFDNTPPTGTVANSPAISSNPSFTVSWAGTGSDGAGSGLSGFYDIRVKINNGSFTTLQTNFQSESIVFNGADGNTYGFEVAAHDVAGNTEVFTGVAEATTTVDVNANDVTAPGGPTNLTAAGSNPSPWQSTPQFQIQWQPPSDPSGIRRALYKLGSAPNANFDTTASVSSGASVAVAATQEDGQNFHIWFQDQRGNVDFRNRGTVRLRYDNTAATVTSIDFLNPDFDPNWFSQALTSEANVVITYSERHLLRIQMVSPTLSIDRDVTNVPSGIGVSRQFNIGINSKVDGSHKLTFTLTDSAGNVKVDSTRIALDGTPSTGTLANSPDTSGSTTFLVTWGGTGSDGSGSGLSGVYDVRFQEDGGPWQSWKTNFAGVSDNFTGEDNKEYGFEAAAYDNVGNREQFVNVAESVTFVDPTFQDITAPSIVHTPPSQVDQGQGVTLTAQISDNNQVAQVLLFFKSSGDVGFQSQPMSSTIGNNYEFTLSATQISATGVNYFISATDGTNFSFHPPTDAETSPNNISVRITGTGNQGLARSTAQPAGNNEAAYRMISVPLNLQNGTPLAVLEDDLGAYDPQVWRLFQYNATNDEYVEYPSIGAFTPGKALWLIVRDANKIIDSGIGATVATNQPFTINLVAGWNDIALPFPFAVNAADVQVTQGNASTVMGPYTFQSQWQIPTQVTVLQPWEGYSYYSAAPATLSILAIASAQQISPSLAKAIFDSEWHIAIGASSGGLRDGANFIGVSQQSLLDRDALDFLEPPYIANHVSVVFRHDDWSGIRGAFTTDFRPLIEDGQVWPFEVESTLGGQPITLSFANLESLPLELEAIVLDRQTLKQQNIRQNPEYNFALQQNESARQFDLVIGTREYVENSAALNDPTPQSFSLSQNYPNPFNAGTSLTYQLSEPAQVSIKVLNILGQHVRTLVSQQQPAGVYRINWDAAADNGMAISSGIYLIQMEAGSFRQIRKVVLVR